MAPLFDNMKELQEALRDAPFAVNPMLQLAHQVMYLLAHHGNRPTDVDYLWEYLRAFDLARNIARLRIRLSDRAVSCAGALFANDARMPSNYAHKLVQKAARDLAKVIAKKREHAAEISNWMLELLSSAEACWNECGWLPLRERENVERMTARILLALLSLEVLPSRGWRMKDVMTQRAKKRSATARQRRHSSGGATGCICQSPCSACVS